MPYLEIVWVLLCSALVFIMQAGFAMLETGLTRAKNAGNIIMKNLMDYCLGSLLFWVIGFGLMFGSSAGGFIGKPEFLSFESYGFTAGLPVMAFILYASVFCSTSTTIASGALAERTSFRAYLIYSAVMSALVYPISGHWIWNSSGWLRSIGFHDFAGGTAVHVVGAAAAFAGAAIVGPRIGKFNKDGKSKAIPGHNLTIAALGIFILWFGWFGFNGSSVILTENGFDPEKLGGLFFNTNISAAACAATAMFITWARYGKPDVSMTLNGALAGLVGITCGCDVVTPIGALCIGIVCGFVLVFGVELINKLKVDDPVGAVSVHGLCGATGSILTGVFSTETGVIYTDSFGGLGVQILGVLAAACWSGAVIGGLFLLLKHTIGVRVSAENEIAGLDKCEHGLASSYADFVGSAHLMAEESEGAPIIRAIDESTELNKDDYKTDGKIRKVVVIMNASKFETLRIAMDKLDITGMTVSNVSGCGIQKGRSVLYRGAEYESHLLPKIKVEIVISTVPLGLLVDTLKKVLYTGKVGDGKIFVYEVENVIKIRTGAEGKEALE